MEVSPWSLGSLCMVAVGTLLIAGGARARRFVGDRRQGGIGRLATGVVLASIGMASLLLELIGSSLAALR